MKESKSWYEKRIIKFILIIGVLLLIIGCVAPTPDDSRERRVQQINEITDSLEENQRTDVKEPERPSIEVSRVIDGDTIELNTGERVRLICIDTPESGDYYYEEASNYLERLVLGEEVELVKDVSETDSFGRLLRYVYLGNTFVNYELVKNGYAEVYRYPPDTSKCGELERAETIAKSNNLGIWNVPEEEPIAPSTTTNSECSYNKYNCGDFSTHNEAQELYSRCGGVNNDVHQLDRDKDGLACETLP